jgi:hypothetical protein
MVEEAVAANLPPMKNITFHNACELKSKKYQDIQTQLK